MGIFRPPPETLLIVRDRHHYLDGAAILPVTAGPSGSTGPSLPGAGGVSPGEPSVGPPDLPIAGSDPIIQTITIEEDGGSQIACIMSSIEMRDQLVDYGIDVTHWNRLCWPAGGSVYGYIDVLVPIAPDADPPSGPGWVLRMGGLGNAVQWRQLTISRSKLVFLIAGGEAGQLPQGMAMLRLVDRRYGFQNNHPRDYDPGPHSPIDDITGVPTGLRNVSDADTKIEYGAGQEWGWNKLPTANWNDIRPTTPDGVIGPTLFADSPNDDDPFNWHPGYRLGTAIDRWCMNTAMMYVMRRDGVDAFDRIGGSGILGNDWSYTWNDLITDPTYSQYKQIGSSAGDVPLPSEIRVRFSRGYSGHFVADINTGDYESEPYSFSLGGFLEPVTIWDRAFEILDENRAKINGPDLNSRAAQLVILYQYRYILGNGNARWNKIIDLNPCGSTQYVEWGYTHSGEPYTEVQNDVRWWGYGMAETDPPPWSGDEFIACHGRIRKSRGVDMLTLLTTAPPSLQLGQITNVDITNPKLITYNAISREDSTLVQTDVPSAISVTDGEFDMLPSVGFGDPCIILLPSVDGETALTLWVGEKIDSEPCP